MPSALHLAPSDHIDARYFLLEYGGLRGTQLRIGQIALGELA
jgi:hypothetical protein